MLKQVRYCYLLKHNFVQFGVVWCGVVYCSLLLCTVVWCGVVCCTMIFCMVLRCGVAYCGVLRCGPTLSEKSVPISFSLFTPVTLADASFTSVIFPSVEMVTNGSVAASIKLLEYCEARFKESVKNKRY